MRVRHDEGVAIHIGPEPCAGIREGAGEASAGEGIGQPLSRERSLVPGAELGGAAVNYAFIEHFQEVAPGHFTVRRLERVYGKNLVRAEYERLAQEH